MAPKLGGNALAQFNRQQANMKDESGISSIQWKIKMQELFTISWEGESGYKQEPNINVSCDIFDISQVQTFSATGITISEIDFNDNYLRAIPNVDLTNFTQQKYGTVVRTIQDPNIFAPIRIFCSRKMNVLQNINASSLLSVNTSSGDGSDELQYFDASGLNKPNFSHNYKFEVSSLIISAGGLNFQPTNDARITCSGNASIKNISLIQTSEHEYGKVLTLSGINLIHADNLINLQDSNNIPNFNDIEINDIEGSLLSGLNISASGRQEKKINDMDELGNIQFSKTFVSGDVEFNRTANPSTNFSTGLNKFCMSGNDEQFEISEYLHIPEAIESYQNVGNISGDYEINGPIYFGNGIVEDTFNIEIPKNNNNSKKIIKEINVDNMIGRSVYDKNIQTFEFNNIISTNIEYTMIGTNNNTDSSFVVDNQTLTLCGSTPYQSAMEVANIITGFKPLGGINRLLHVDQFPKKYDNNTIPYTKKFDSFTNTQLYHESINHTNKDSKRQFIYSLPGSHTEEKINFLLMDENRQELQQDVLVHNSNNRNGIKFSFGVCVSCNYDLSIAGKIRVMASSGRINIKNTS